MAEDDYDLDLSFDDDGSVRKDLESGKLCSFRVKTAIFFRGNEISADYLGGCIYARPSDFMDHRGIRNYVPPGGKAGQCGSYFSDMIRTAISEARVVIAKMQGIKLRA